MIFRNYNILTKLIFLNLIVLFGAFSASAQTPVANFTGSPLTGCSPIVVVFQDQSSGNPTRWNWDFGNGNTSTLQNPTASYFTPGNYTVSLTVTNASGSNTLTRSQLITVYEPPSVGFSANITSGCFPLRVQFSDISTGGTGNNNVSWLWDFGNGFTSTQQNPSALYTTAGNFSVTLKVTNDKGCSKTLSRSNYISVAPGVTASFTNSLSTTCSPPSNITFTNTSTGPPTLSYFWNFGDGNTSTLPNPVHTYTGSGNFTAMLVATSSAGCQDTAWSDTITIGGYTTNFTAPAQACINELISFTNSSVPVPLSSTWNFGDGGTATTINATHSYSATGTYNVWLHNTYATCQDSVMNTITINPRPQSDFSSPLTTKCQPPLTVNFQDISSGGAVAWQWNFGDGGTSTSQNPSHTYNAYGSFNVTLITTNGFGCTDTIVKPGFVVIRRANISIPGIPARGCIPYTTSLTPIINSVDAVTSYLWDFGDGGSSTLANPTHTYSTQGFYTIKLYITTSSGCTDSLIVPGAIRVGTKPVANFTAAPIPVCGKQPVFFTDLSVPADEWNWSFGDGGTSILQNPMHSYSDTGYFDVQLIATNFGCTDTLERLQYVRVLPPIARFTPTPDCNNRLRFTFTDQSIAPQTWEWNFGDGSPLVTTQNPVHIFPSLGVYNVRLVVTNGSCTDTAFQIVKAVNEIPDFTGTPTSGCKISGVVFQAVNINPANITNYFWDFGDGDTTNVNSTVTSHGYTTSGTYTVTLTITDINGCRNSITKTNYIRVNGPTAGFSATNAAGCSGLTTTFNDLSTTDGVNNIVNWQWHFGDGTIQNFTAAPFTHTYTTADTFNVKLVVTDAAGCKDSVNINNLVMTSDPIPDFSTTDTLTCPGSNVRFTNKSTPGTTSTFQWLFGDGGSSTLFSPTHAYTATGNYSVKLIMTDGLGCVDSLEKNLYITVDRPIASFTMSDSVSSCLPFEVNFSNTSSYYTYGIWDFGDGSTSAAPNPVHYYSSPGTYTIKLVVFSRGDCADSTFRTIRVYDTAGSRVSYTPLGGCKPLQVSLNAFSSGPMASYYWDFGDGYTISTTTPSINHTYASFGDFLPKIIMEDPSGCQIPVQGLDTVYVIGANTKFGYSDSLFCDMGTVNFTDSTAFNDPLTSYNWSFGDGGTSSLQNPVHQYTTPGLYTVQLAVQTQRGCRDTLTKPLVIKVVQRPLIDIGGDSIICVNSPVTHSGLFIQPDTSVVNWQWFFPNGNTSTSQNPLPQTYTTPGTYTITTYAINSTGCRDTTTQSLLVNPLPVITLPGQLTVQSGFPVTIPATYSANVVSWLWSPAGGLSCTTCPTPDAVPKFDTRYQIYATDDNGCTNIGNVLVVVICKNSNLFVPNTFSPNGDGSNDAFYPRGRGLERVKTLRIFNRWGEVVFEKRDFPINDANVGWNGTFKGRKPQADVYVYQLEVFCENGDIITLNGNIALVL